LVDKPQKFVLCPVGYGFGGVDIRDLKVAAFRAESLHAASVTAYKARSTSPALKPDGLIWNMAEASRKLRAVQSEIARRKSA
jgi:hypothetical protein